MTGMLDIEFAWLPYLMELLGKGESRALALTTRSLHDAFAGHTRPWAEQKWSWIQAKYHPLIRDLLGGSYAMMRMPRLVWQPIFRGTTGYIDGVGPRDMDSPVMLGCNHSSLDHNQPLERPYVALRTRTRPNRMRGVTVLFQRYSGHQGTWASSDYGGVMTEAGHFMVDGVIKHELLAFNLMRLLEREKTILRFTKYVGQDVRSVPCWLD